MCLRIMPRRCNPHSYPYYTYRMVLALRSAMDSENLGSDRPYAGYYVDVSVQYSTVRTVSACAPTGLGMLGHGQAQGIIMHSFIMLLGAHERPHCSGGFHCDDGNKWPVQVLDKPKPLRLGPYLFIGSY